MNEVAVNETLVTTKELAETLGVDVDTVNNTVSKLGFSEVLRKSTGGRPTKVFDEKQATLIKQEIQKHHNLSSRQIDGISTDYEMELMTQKVLAYHIQKANEYKERAEIAEKKLVEQAPKVEFYDTVTQSTDTIDMKDVAKTLNIKGLGRNNLFEFLREKKILDKNNLPYQSYVSQGYFKIVESHYEYPQGCINVNQKTVVFQKGLDFIRRTIEKEYK